MKIVILLLLGLTSLAASAPQSRFGSSRQQPARARAGENGNTTETSHAATKMSEADVDAADWDKTSGADLDAAGPDAGADEDDAKDGTPAKSFVVDGEMKPAYGLDFAKERRRLANLRKHLVKPDNKEGDESAVTASPHDMPAVASASGHRRASAGQQDSTDNKAAVTALGHRRAGTGLHDSNDDKVAAPASGPLRAGAGKQDSNDQESTLGKNDGSQNPPASNPRRRFHSTSSSSSSVSDASQGNEEETLTDSTDDSSALPPKETTFEKRRPALRRRQQSTPAPSDDQSQDESSDAGSSTQSDATDSTSPAQKQKPAAGTPSGGSMKDRLERYRQRQAGRLGATSQTGGGDGSVVAQKSKAQSDATEESDAKEKSDATADASATGLDFQNSEDGRPSA